MANVNTRMNIMQLYALSGTIRYFRKDSTLNGMLYRLTWPGRPLLQLKAKSTQVRLKGLAHLGIRSELR